MKKTARLLVFLFAALAVFTACEEVDNTPNDYENWKFRNDTAFANRLSTANAAIASAKAAHGDRWEDFCAWRTYRRYTYQADEAFEQTDSICLQILERGIGNASPIYSDSVLVNYIGRLIPTATHPTGRVFDHSGLSGDPNEVFNNEFAAPAKLLPSNLVVGFSTALMYMRPGDKCRDYIPAPKG